MERSILKIPVSSLRHTLEFLDFEDLIVLRSVCKHFECIFLPRHLVCMHCAHLAGFGPISDVASGVSVLNVGSDIIVRPNGMHSLRRLLSSFSHLEGLCIDGFNTMTDRMLESVLLKVTGIKHLGLHHCVCLEAPLSIRSLRRLESLELTGCTRVYDDFFKLVLIEMKALKRLVLRETSIATVTLGFKHLTHLHISFLNQPQWRDDDMDGSVNDDGK
jgi:hypothetical protein